MGRRLIWLAMFLLALVLPPRLARGTLLDAGINAIQGTVTRKEGSASSPLPDGVLLLYDQTGSLVGVTSTDKTGQYRFEKLPTGIYRVIAVDPPGGEGGDALPGPHAVKLDRSTLQVTVVPGVTLYPENSFVKLFALATPGRIERLLALGDAIPLKTQLGLSGIEPLDLDPREPIIRRATDDGSLVMLDPAGTALLRLGAGRPEVLLDTTSRDPVDGITLTHLLRAETGRDGVSAILALRADNTRGIYRLDNGTLARLALLTNAADPNELAISDGGQVAYVARTASGALALFQMAGKQSVELLHQGQVLPNGATVLGFSDLSGNDAGDLTLLVSLPPQPFAWAVVRKTSAGLDVVAVTGQVVETGRGTGITGPLASLFGPRIGPDRTVVFQGTGPISILNVPFFANFYVARPGPPLRGGAPAGPSPVLAPARLQPLLPGPFWDRDPRMFDYEIAADGTVAVRARVTAPLMGEPVVAWPGLYLVAPTGAVTNVAVGRMEIQPVGRPAFGPAGRLYFLARNPAWRSFDRNGRIPAGLFRYRPGETDPVAVAVPGQDVPGKPEQQLLGVPQRPVVSPKAVAFAALFGGREPFPVSTAGLFTVPLDGTLANGTLVAAEGAGLPLTALVVGFHDFYYTADETLLFDTFVRQGLVVGQLIATLPPRATAAAVSRSQAATPAQLLVNRLVKGDDLGEGRKLSRVLGQVLTLSSVRLLFAAQFSQPTGAGEGLFSIDRGNNIQKVAVTGDPATGSGLTGARFIGFGEAPRDQAADSEEAARYAAYPPSISADESVVFKARLQRGGGTISGLFRWARGAAPAPVAVSDVPLMLGDSPPYEFKNWAAGASGRTYFLEQPQTQPRASMARLFEHSAAGLRPLVIPGQTRVASGNLSILTGLSDFVLSGFGELFVQGASANGAAVLRVDPTGLTPVAVQGQPVPPSRGGRPCSNSTGLAFDGTFDLRRDSACSDLLFAAEVQSMAQPPSVTRGLFRRQSPGGLETLLVQSITVAGARDPTVCVIPPDQPCGRSFGTLSTSQQKPTEFLAFAARESSGRWAIYRVQTVQDPTTGKPSDSTVVIAREGQQLPDGTRFISLDPSILLGRPTDSGPVFTLSPAGDVAFLASDGQRWAIYRFSDRS